MIKWSKPDAQGRLFAEVNHRSIGYVKLAGATQLREYEWELVALGANVFVDRQGSCKTQGGAKKALARNWQRFCDRFNLVSRDEPQYMATPRYPTPRAISPQKHDNVIALGGRDWP